jgi:CheY-like chemotaxis protein
LGGKRTEPWKRLLFHFAPEMIRSESMMQRKILLIDDDEAIRTIVKLSLEVLAGWTTLVASSGPEGVTMAAAEQPDAILLDMMMPEVDGIQTLNLLRSGPATSHTPVLFLTAKGKKLDVARLAGKKVQGVIAKPFDATTLAAEVSALLGWDR